MTDIDDVSVSRKFYNELIADSRKLRKLEAAGVDNWEGYSDALEDDEDDV